MTKLLYVIVIIITIFFGLTFTYMNNQVVEIHYLNFNREVSLSLLLLCTLVLGLLAGFFINFLSSFKLRRNLSKAKKELRDQQSTAI